MDVAASVFGDLERRVVAMRAQVIDVLELLGNVDARVLGFHLHGYLDAVVDGFPDVALVVHDYDLGAVVAHELAALFRNGIGHDDARLVAAHGADERQADSLVAARRLDDDAAGADFPALLGFLDHHGSGARLHRSAHVHALVLHEDLGHSRLDDAV